MALTKAQQRDKVVNIIKSREGKNQYTQGSNRDKVGSGYGDCSATVRYCYKQALGIDIGVNTDAQINSKLGKTVNLTIKNGIPDESKMLPGDCLYFRGNDSSRTKGVGHVEMYVGNGQISGHGSGIGPTRKNMAAYCKQRQSTKSTSSVLKNRGLVEVRRFIDDKATDTNTKTPKSSGTSLKVGKTINFTGNKHYTSSSAATGKTCKPGKAKITQVNKGSKHPYHIVGIGDCTAHGWVDADKIKETATKKGKVICKGLHLRSKANQTSTSLAIMNKGDEFTILGKSNGWYKVTWKGITGYCSASTKYVSV